jgi:hypothetical protein
MADAWDRIGRRNLVRLIVDGRVSSRALLYQDDQSPRPRRTWQTRGEWDLGEGNE